MNEPEHLGICNHCLLNCFWQSSPTGGWWIHDWPNRLLEVRYKSDPRIVHDADPGWKPQEEIDENGQHTTSATATHVTNPEDEDETG